MAVTVKGISLLETTLSEHADEQFDGSASLISRILFSNLFARIGDQNTRLREAVEDIFMQMAGYKTLIGPSVVVSNLTKTQIATSAKPKQVIGNL